MSLTPARNAMVAKMLEILIARHGSLNGSDAEVADTMHRLIAAVLDNLPRDVMEMAAWNSYRRFGCGPRQIVAEIVAAARREVLGHE